MKRVLIALSMLCTAPAHAQMTARCYIFQSGPNLQVEATSTASQFEIIVRQDRCLIFIQQGDSPLFPGKRAAWLIEGADGDILSEFWGRSQPGVPWRASDMGLCSFRGGRFPTSQCSWAEWKDRSDQM